MPLWEKERKREDGEDAEEDQEKEEEVRGEAGYLGEGNRRGETSHVMSSQCFMEICE